MSEDVNKLPKWAQYLFAKLERNLEDERQKVAAYSGIEPTRVAVDPDAPLVRQGDTPTYLRERTEIQFTLANGDQLEVRLDQDCKALKIYSQGKGTLVVAAHTSNHISIHTTSEF